MVPEISRGEPALGHVAAAIESGDTSTLTFVTVALGASTTGMLARLPAVVVTLDATQHFLPELNGSTIYHQPPSPDLPTI
jgi:hypothetical protein